VSMPHSKLKSHIAEILKSEGYIAGWNVEDARVGQTLTLSLKFGPNRERSIAGIKRVSKPGLRVYTPADQVPRVLGGMGIAVLSTNQGLLTDRQARERKVGGEILCQVW
jgi:small subunit ribosomal protein S8